MTDEQLVDEEGVKVVRGNMTLLVEPSEAYLAALAVAAPPVVQSPDAGGLLLAIFAAFGKNAARALANKYPDFQIGLDRANWPVARAAVDDALAAGDLGQSAYDTIQSLFEQFGIPEA